MAPTQPALKAQAQAVQTKDDSSPNGVDSVFKTSLLAGAATGSLGLFWGKTSGIVNSAQSPLARTLSSGVEFFGVGAAFYGTRHLLLQRHGPVENATPQQQLGASALAGAISQGLIIALTRGPRPAVPATIIGACLGGGGQKAVHSWALSRQNADEKPRTSWFDGKLNPMTKLTDEEYEQILEEKILRIDVEIAIVDDKIATLRALKEEEMKAAERSTPQAPTGKDQA